MSAQKRGMCRPKGNTCTRRRKGRERTTNPINVFVKINCANIDEGKNYFGFAVAVIFSETLDHDHTL